MLTLILAAATLGTPPHTVPVEGYVARQFDGVGHLVGYNLVRRMDVYGDPIVLPLVTTDRKQDRFLKRSAGKGVRVTGWKAKRASEFIFVVESVAEAAFMEFP